MSSPSARITQGGARRSDTLEITSADLVKALVAIEGRPWAELGKSRRPLTQNKLARMLAVRGVRIN
ncbi:MAG TPA: hypothetical protein VE251_11985, partial [Xanthobacteraceae bacterium]|nr:hypothetical protein [Xanthobacteraceae bacterium]